MKELTESEFIQRLIDAGWAREYAEKEVAGQLYGELGDCDGDLQEIEDLENGPSFRNQIDYLLSTVPAPTLKASR